MLSETAETPVVGMLPVPVILNVRGVPPPAPSPILVVPTLPMFERVSATRVGVIVEKLTLLANQPLASMRMWALP